MIVLLGCEVLNFFPALLFLIQVFLNKFARYAETIKSTFAFALHSEQQLVDVFNLGCALPVSVGILSVCPPHSVCLP